MAGLSENWFGQKTRFCTRKNFARQDVNYLSCKLSKARKLRYGIQGILLFSAISYIFYHSVILVCASWIFVIPYLGYKGKEWNKKRRSRILLQFRDGILALASLLSAGYSVENAMGKVAEELEMIWGKDSDMAAEFSRMSNQLTMNCTVESVWMEFALRTGLEEIENFAGIFSIVKRTGGELAAVIQWAVQRLNQQYQTEEQIQTLIASRRYEQRLMNVMPLAILCYVSLSSPELLNIMYTTLAGRVIMTVCLIIYIIAYLLAEKIVGIEV